MTINMEYGISKVSFFSNDNAEVNLTLKVEFEKIIELQTMFRSIRSLLVRFEYTKMFDCVFSYRIMQ